VDRHLPHDTARNARFFIGVVNAAKMGISSAGQQPELQLTHLKREVVPGVFSPAGRSPLGPSLVVTDQ
jgi:hypothetical protein